MALTFSAVRALVTGSSGFVGQWLCGHLIASGDTVTGSTVDINDAAGLVEMIHSCEPEAVYHLAGQANVGASWENPAETFSVNALGTVNVLEAVRTMTALPRVLCVGSAEVYGKVAAHELPLTEMSPLRPVSPYASSKVAAEYAAVQAFLGFGVPTLRVRAFNHIGPGQGSGFVVSALAKRIVDAQRSGQRQITAGNITTRRDFTDVRDVVRAYRLIMSRGEPGAVYNVCTGVDLSIAELAQRLIDLAGGTLELVVDPEHQRIVDVPVLRGDAMALRVDTGWIPEVPLDATLTDVLEYWASQ